MGHNISESRQRLRKILSRYGVAEPEKIKEEMIIRLGGN
jgi:hypothetical protein